MKDIYICPSILSADLLNLSKEVNLVKKAGAYALHVDVMDGHFVKNISFGVPIVSSLKGCGLPLDVHLMMTNPFNFIESFVCAGADFLTFHVECFDNLKACIKKTRNLGCKVGLALKPSTDVGVLVNSLIDWSLVDLVVVMTVEPGFAGQKFISGVLSKINQIKELNSNFNIAVDGGIDCLTAGLAIRAGANWLIAGSAIFNSLNYENVITGMKIC